MSGAKYVSVSESQWRKAQRAERRLAQVQANLPVVLAEQRRRMSEELGRVHAAVTARQDRVESALSDLSEHTRELEERTDARLRAQAEELLATQEAIADQERRLRAELERERAERRREIGALGGRVDELREESDRAGRAALAVFGDAVAVHDVIRDELPHERFAPGRLDRLRVRLDVARANLEAQAPGYALTQVQDLYLDLSELRAEVAHLDQRWRARQAMAVAALRGAAQRITDNAAPPVLDGEGDELPDHRLDVDFWTDGGLSELRAEVERLTGEAAGPDAAFTIEEFGEIVERRAPGVADRLDALVDRAAGRLLASQRRVNIADRVVRTLQANGYRPADHAYADDDYREAFLARLRHPDASEVVVEVVPVGDEEMTVRLLSYDDAPSAGERERRAHEVAEALREDGLDVGGVGSDQGEPDPSLRDIRKPRREREQIRRRDGR
ncbi:hypothetical protein ACFVH6_41420 [Spirillospora sp. NPDC127200]